MEQLKNTLAIELFRHSLDKFLAKDMKGWSKLCAERLTTDGYNLKSTLTVGGGKVVFASGKF